MDLVWWTNHGRPRVLENHLDVFSYVIANEVCVLRIAVLRNTVQLALRCELPPPPQLLPRYSLLPASRSPLARPASLLLVTPRLRSSDSSRSTRNSRRTVLRKTTRRRRRRPMTICCWTWEPRSRPWARISPADRRRSARPDTLVRGGGPPIVWMVEYTFYVMFGEYANDIGCCGMVTVPFLCVHSCVLSVMNYIKYC